MKLACNAIPTFQDPWRTFLHGRARLLGVVPEENAAFDEGSDAGESEADASERRL